MSSKSIQIIGGPGREHAYVDQVEHALLVKVVNPGGGGAGGDVNLSEYGGVAVGAGNAIHVQPGAGVIFDVSGTVSVNNFPATQDVSGTVSVDNFPTVIDVRNFPASQTVDDGGGSLTVDGTLAVTQSGSWSVTTGPEKASDASFSPGAIGALGLAIRNDTLDSLVDADGDYAPLQVTAAGALYVELANSTVAVTQSGSWSVDTGLSKAEDSSHASGDLGVPMLVVRQTILSASTSAEGDYGNLKQDAQGALWVRPSSSVAVVNTSHPSLQATVKVEDRNGVGVGPWASVVSHGTACDANDGGFVLKLPRTTLPKYDELFVPTSGDAYASPYVDEGGCLVTSTFLRGRAASASRILDIVNEGETWDSIPFGAEQVRGALVSFIGTDDPTNLTRVTDGNFSLAVTDTSRRLWVRVAEDVVINGVSPGTSSTSLGKAEDAAHASGHVGVMALAVRNDTASALAGTNGDYIPFTTDALGRLWTRIPGDIVTTLPLSGSSHGRPVQITGTGTGSAVTLHTATTTTGQLDKVRIDLSNTSDAAVEVTIEWGTTGTGNELKITVPPKDTIRGVGPIVIGGNATTDTIRAYAGTASVINAVGYVERLS